MQAACAPALPYFLALSFDDLIALVANGDLLQLRHTIELKLEILFMLAELGQVQRLRTRFCS